MEHFLIKHRAIKALVIFSTSNPSHRKKFYGRAAKCRLENGGGVVTHIFNIEQVARRFGLTIANCGRQAVHRLVRYFFYCWYHCY